MSITTTTVTITTTTTTTTPLTFPLFPLLPTELRDLIWSAAASLAPQIQFFLNPHHPSSRLFEPCEAPINLVPHPESGAHNTVSLSLACRAARAAVQRHAKTARMAGGKRTVLRTTLGPQVQFYGGWGASASSASMPLALAPRTAVNLDFELERDVVCFGGPEADGAGVWDIIDWGEGNHILFDAVRRFAVRYRPGWERVRGGEEHLRHDVRCPGGWVGTKGGGGGFCSRCVSRLVKRFVWLREFYLILDERELGEQVEGDRGGDGGLPGPLAEQSVFNSYKRTYFTLEMSRGGAGVREAREVLKRVRRNLYDPEHYQMPWISSLKLGLLSWREDQPS